MIRILTLCVLLLPMMGHADVPRVAVDIAPVHGLVSRVMEGVGAPELILPPGASPHDHAMRPSEARAVAEAELVIWIGPALTPWLAGSLDSLAHDADRLTLLDHPMTVTLDARDDALFSDDHDHDHAHDHGDIDPHAWLSPENGIAWLGLIASELTRLDPANAETYKQNARLEQDKLRTLTYSLKTKFEKFDNPKFMVFHDAYHYFEDSFDLHSIGAISLSDGQQPSPGHLADLRNVLHEVDHLCVVSEPQANQALVDAVAQNATITMAVLDPIDGTIELGPGYYHDLLFKLGQDLTDCLN